MDFGCALDFHYLWLTPKVGCVSAIKMKIFDVLFCIALDFHYLCGQFTNICIVCYD